MLKIMFQIFGVIIIIENLIFIDQYKEKNTLYLSFAPKKLKLFERIQSLRKKFTFNEKF